MIELGELIKDKSWPADIGQLVLHGLCEDSRRVQPGDGYVAVKGAVHDGHDFAASAVANGAQAVLAEQSIEALPVPVCVVPNLAARRSELAAQVYAQPSQATRCIGVTGTNGKTSVCHYLTQLLDALGEPCGYMGTLGWGRLPELQDPGLTTVDACLFQARLRTLANAGATHCALEISSHALDQGRVDAVAFDSAVFTNLTRDHLDYHGTLANYAAAKRQLFERSGLRCVVTNVDDELGREIGEQLQDSAAAVVTYGQDAAVSWRDVQATPDGFIGTWHTAWGDAPLRLGLLGRFSIENVAAALAVLLAEGFALADLVRVASTLTTVPGRMELFSSEQLPNVIVDFAHTPDALERAGNSVREHCSGELYVVFGCGGDRDRGKRAEMGHVAAQFADHLWLTNDNPRSESPEQIVADIHQGLSGSCEPKICLDRADAIAKVIAAGSPGDVILLAGKGHETYQESNGKKVPFSDRAVVAAHLGLELPDRAAGEQG